jgi:ubiquinone/menaquinone biosynthesis C-methylase UbiE
VKVVQKKPADWTAEDIASFWDWQSKNAARQQQYFTAVMAPGIVRFLKNKGLLKGNVLDYGCGAGHLLEQLVKEKDVAFYGLDFSVDSLSSTKNKTANAKNLKELVLVNELPGSFNDNMFDTITCIETIEHLQNDQLHATMKELYRVAKPKGKIFITTPFNEDLEGNLCFCPFCKSEFHQMQHMQSFDIAGLTALAKQYQFDVAYCNHINIEKWRLGAVKYTIKNVLKEMVAATGLAEKRKEKRPNLVAILVKP